MPPEVALLFCAGFVIYLLKVEHEESAGVSSALWIPTLFLVVCFSKSLDTWLGLLGLGAQNLDVESGSPWDRALNVLLIGSGVAVLIRRKMDWRGIIRENRWLLAIYLYALISIIWSDYSFVSIKRYVRFIATPLMAVVILSETNPRQALESVLRRTAFLLIPVSLMLIKYYPHLGVAYSRWSGELMWVGVAYQKNSLGILCFVSAFFLVWRLLRNRCEREVQDAHPPSRRLYADVLVLAMSLYLLKGPGSVYSASETSICVFALGAISLLALRRMHRQGRSVALPILMGFTIALFLYGAMVPFGAREIGSGLLHLIGRDASFTDRDEIWAKLIPIIHQHPVLGLGFGGFWIVPVDGVNTPHNGYLGILLQLGIVGVVLVFGFVLSMCRACHACLNEDFWWGSFSVCLLLMVVLHNTSEASFVETSDALWSLLVFLRILLPVTPVPGEVPSSEDFPQMAGSQPHPVDGRLDEPFAARQ